MVSKAWRFRELISAEEILMLNDLMGFSTIREMERRFLTAAQNEAKYGSARY